MELAAHISFRPSYSYPKVVVMRILRFLQTGYLLHLMGICSILLVYFFGRKVLMLRAEGEGTVSILINGFVCLYFFSLIIFSLLDARSRYQNYKMAKDRLYKYGFDARLLKPFIYSRCQRDAIAAAVGDLELRKEWTALKHKMGFRWYHLLPDMVIKNPWLLFTRDYWSKTLFVRKYNSKYFLW